MKKIKSKRLAHGAWEKNGSLFESMYWVTASLLALRLDPTAIEQNRKYPNYIIDIVVKQLKAFWPMEPFTRTKVALYVNASSTNEAIINKDKTNPRTKRYYKQLEQFRRGVSIK